MLSSTNTVSRKYELTLSEHIHHKDVTHNKIAQILYALEITKSEQIL